METFHILHLAASWPVGETPTSVSTQSSQPPPPLSAPPADPAIVAEHPSPQPPPPDVSKASKDGKLLAPRPRIRAAAAQIVFAARNSREFITPEEVERVETWAGRGVLEALHGFAIESEVTKNILITSTTESDGPSI